MAYVTTRDVNVNLKKERRPLTRVTTKNVDVSHSFNDPIIAEIDGEYQEMPDMFQAELVENQSKVRPIVSTHTARSPEEISEDNERRAVMEERKEEKEEAKKRMAKARAARKTKQKPKGKKK